MMIYYASLATGILLGVAAQLLLKVGASGEGGIVEQFLKPQSIGGLALYGFAAAFYMLALRKIPVSVAFPSVSLSYAVLAVLGNVWLKEPLGLMQIGGIVLIMIGVIVLNQHA
ncbi:MAG TPA: EamA family transporter [Alphaproteobacteria bacterium]|jgi:multidrug transporter EmrE-like cation transporter